MIYANSDNLEPNLYNSTNSVSIYALIDGFNYILEIGFFKTPEASCVYD